MSWYRTYRPQHVADLHITPVREQLQAILQTGKVSHAYIFAGPKGTGKTSSARILARVLNDKRNQEVLKIGSGQLQEPDLDDSLLQKIARGSSQVVIEQDAASHRGIDDIRLLQEQVSLVPNEGYYRVVILDEVHMLTTEAFNALLKMLEEPPERVVFILATTELQKVPATVLSRCQLIAFRMAQPSELQAVLKGIAEKEKISVTDEQLARLAQAAQGSFRDAVKLFEQGVKNGELDADALQRLAGNSQQAPQLLRALAQKDVKAVEEFFASSRLSGQNFAALQTEVLAALQERLHRAIERSEAPKTLNAILSLLEYFAESLRVQPEPIEGLRFELACLRWCLGREVGVPEQLELAEKEQPKNATQESQSKQKSSPVNPGAISRQPLYEKWEEILIECRLESSAVEALLRNASLGEVRENTVEIILALPFHKERMETVKYRTVVQNVLQKVTQKTDFTILFTVAPQVDQLAQASGQSEGAQSSGNSDDKLLAAVEDLLVNMP